MYFDEKMIYSGTSGLVAPVPQSLYPLEFQGKSRLAYYASFANSLEVNSSFYKSPKISTIKKWAESVDDHFQFTFKIPKVISHSKGLVFDPQETNNFIALVSNIGNKKGCLLAQFPPSLKVDKIGALQSFLAAIKPSGDDGWKIAFEFRDRSWYKDEVYDLLASNNVCLVIHDLPASTTPLKATTNFMYVRFHGPDGRYRGCYSDDFLLEWANNIKAWIADGRVVYYYFNNTMGDAYKNLQTLNRLVKA